MFDARLRVLKDKLFDPVARALPFVSPGFVTALALVVGLGAVVALWEGRFGWGLVFWLGNRVLDGLDGSVARVQGRSSDLGGYVDLLADFVVYGAIPVVLALRPGADPTLVASALVLLVTFYVNAASWMVLAAILEKRRHGAEARGEPTSISIPEGVISGTETVVFYTLFFVLPAQQGVLFTLMAGLTALTVLQRLVWARRALGTS
ncbi:MAG: CDP-alcohol phosphatidyltransferase family protein [Gemmatimonadota bacterium]|nr:CDP-alcohol phosphatidyltransferase family protein [Gemmatimonadota bacterium]